MKQALTFVFSLFFLASNAQGIDFFHGTWQEAIELAKENENLVFVDAYTTWCGPCKKMSKQVFPDENVGTFFNANFVNLKLDMESKEGRAFNSKYPVTGYPTFLFINGEGEIVHRTSGFRPPESFIDVAKVAVKKDDRSAALQEKYESGERSFDFMLKYVKALNRGGKSSLKISNDYMSSKPDITQKQKAEFLYEAVVESDSKLFEDMMKSRKVLASMKSESQMETKITTTCEKTVHKAIDFESESLLKSAQATMNKYLPKQANAFAVTSNMGFYEALGDMERYFKELKKYASNVIDEDHKELVNISSYVLNHYKSEPKAMEIAEDIAKQAIKLLETSDGFMNYSQILLANGKKDEAVRYANKALATARLNGKKTQVIERYIQYLETE